jgi:hypothetical protein
MYPGIEARARDFALRHHKVISAGTDAHSSSEIGYAYVEMNDFNNKEEYLISLAQGKLYGRKSSPLIHLLSTTARFRKQKSKE